MNLFGKVSPNGSHATFLRHTKPYRLNHNPQKRSNEPVSLRLPIAPENLEFADQEARRTRMDMGSTLIAYGLINPQAYCEHLTASAGARYIQSTELQRATAVCAPIDIPRISRTGRIPVSWNTAETRYATTLPASARPSDAPSQEHQTTAVTTRQEVGDALRSTFRRHLCETATGELARTAPEYSAIRRMTGKQTAVALGVAFLTGICLFYAPSTSLSALSLLLTGFFLAVVILRALVLWPPTKPPSSIAAGHRLSDGDLPTYSILVPLFAEANMVPQLLDGLCALDYPAALLDIKLILEERDAETIAAVRAYRLPGCFEVIVVPPCFPQTKPKALNFALPFASGDLLAVFDAEDVPEPGQLRAAAAALRAGPRNLGCVQASLAFYNPTRNWLTRQFALEYASLFDVTLPALARYGLPLPLGGTSNHFRTATLREVGGWDPHNVTEDADLGIRLDRLGYNVDVLKSTTYEEATATFGNWLRQRSRWLKGWMQTWLVHMRSPVQTLREMGPAGFIVFQVLMGGIVISALVHPFFLAAVVYGLLTGALWPVGGGTGAQFLFALQSVVLLMGYLVMMLVGAHACKARGLDGFGRSIASMPFYWLLISVAAWYAIWQLLSAPFYWEKTKHGEKASAKGARPPRASPGHRL